MISSSLRSCPLFKGLNDVEISTIMDKSPHRIRPFEAGDMIAMQDESCDALMILIRGNVQTRMTDASGKMIVVEDLGPSSPLAPAFLYGHEHRMPVTIVARECCEVLYFSRPTFTQMLRNYEPLLLNFLNMISNRSRFLSQKLNFHAFKTIRDKVAHYLLEQKTPGSNIIQLSTTQQQLADYFGVTRPSLARVLSGMAKEGSIALHGKLIEIRDENKLRFG